MLQILWKRGPLVESTYLYRFDEGNKIKEIDEVFQKVSTFYSRDAINYESKTCELLFLDITDGV